jgi:hypothetical protein
VGSTLRRIAYGAGTRLLKLFEIHKGGVVETNTITYCAKRPLIGCTCTWAYVHESSYP